MRFITTAQPREAERAAVTAGFSLVGPLRRWYTSEATNETRQVIEQLTVQKLPVWDKQLMAHGYVVLRTMAEVLRGPENDAARSEVYAAQRILMRATEVITAQESLYEAHTCSLGESRDAEQKL